ncbi:3-hydroxybutyrate dehydrogenase [Thermus tengchongensis]|uniref:3-hydroxybutyrate dehydrogenase n=1 Tax=Thermus tengchongensis TaxID=1214928 RepID=A0ABY2KBD7_9DEIN|nr:3-hydroxybutyrate dehydrogenase [Thermus tengchongensis]TFU18068.1 3-hydroxybutyrate dehydrogenase [Thermus tengchongensis]
MGDFRGKTALVTGGGSGIGLAIARAFAQERARVLVHDVKDASALAAELGGVFLQADLGDPKAVEELGEQAARYGVDILVNNAGFQHIDPVEDFPLETWQRMLQVMLTAPFQLTKALLPGMKAKGWGRILNIASVHGLVASPFKSAYIAAKHGLIGLTRTVALEAGPFGITVNAIAPAYVRTPLVENQIADQARTLGIPESEVVEKVFLAQAAVKRLIEPEEVAELALFLASEKAGAITGAVFPIDLGWTAR